ncbi:MAG: HlyD family secretion protein [Gammaproteobacteria bacterium]|nr:HlyD family secretion protein [Gammaproteobacteria bacterium]
MTQRDSSNPLTHQSLFAYQVMDRNSTLEGPLILKAPAYGNLLALTALVTTALILLILLRGQYAGRISVTGYLHNSSSVLQVTTTRAGRLGQIFVSPQSRVKRGQPLFELLDVDASSSARQVVEQQLTGLGRRRILLEKKLEAEEKIWNLQREGVALESSLLTEQLQYLSLQANLMERQGSDRTRQEQRITSLVAQGYLPEVEIAKSRDLALVTQLSVLDNQREIASNKHRQGELRRTLSILDGQWRMAELEFKSQQTQLANQELELQQTMARKILAPLDATVGEIYAIQGTQVGDRQAIVSLYQASDPITAELAIPARIMPQISGGLSVRIALNDSLVPSLVTLHGTVVEISATPLPTGGRMGPLTLMEPSFRARVALDILPTGIQDGSIYGVHRIISADIIGKPRTLIQWLLRPFKQLQQAVA